MHFYLIFFGVRRRGRPSSKGGRGLWILNAVSHFYHDRVARVRDYGKEQSQLAAEAVTDHPLKTGAVIVSIIKQCKYGQLSWCTTKWLLTSWLSLGKVKK